MKKRDKRKLRIPITLKLWKKEKLIESIVCQSKRKILARMECKKWDKAYIKVSYGGGFYNNSDHFTKESLIKALNSYLEESLLEHAGIGG